jgi:hypothetical protein
MAYIFQQIANRGRAEGITSNATTDARNWFRTTAQSVTSVNNDRLMTDKQNIKPSLVVNDIGKMYMFFYDPKHKDTLPFYDRFPLIFPVDFTRGGFYGINLHYLSPVLRAKLMDNLYTTANNDKYNDTTKLKISYQMLKNASKFKYFEPCFKMYLWDHVQGNFLNVQPQNWDTALMLPTEQFKKATKEQVWKDSRGMI